MADAPAHHRIAYLDGWRGFAIIGVLIGHFVFSEGINLGRFGVELFFVLSGRLMAEILFVRGTSLGKFYFRRFSRVYPLLFISITTIVLLEQASHRKATDLFQYLSAISLTYNYLAPYTGRAFSIDHIWSLCVEEHIYILLGLIALIKRVYDLRVDLLLCIIIAAACINGAVRTYFGGDYYAVYWLSDVRGASILMGAAAFLILKPASLSERYGQLPPVILFGVALLLNADVVPDVIKYTLGTACLASALALLPNAPQPVVRVFTNRPLQWIGLISYSAYLWQQPFLIVMYSHRIKFIAIPAILAVAAASYYLLEQPLRRRLNRALHTKASPIVDANAAADAA
jgi:peptidoglycan/LPS O-acetylase OafA/YrhL